MRIDSIRQWQWMILSILLGCGIGYLRQQAADDLANQYGSEITSQARFEQALVTIEQGRHCFTDLGVHTQSIPNRNGVATRVCVVSGLYFNGQYQPTDGKLVAAWVPAFYLAPIPYAPATDVLNRGDPKASARFAATAKPAVTDFLNALSPAGVRYSRAWWRAMQTWHWVLACFVVIGVLWPIAINLLVFGTLRRPKEERGIDLRQVRPEPEAKKPTVTDEEIEQLVALTEDLEKKLGHDATATSTPQPAASSPVRQLETSAVQSGRPEHQADVNYGAKPDDYYPTAKKPATERSK